MPTSAAAAACFTAADNARFPVYQQAPPPMVDGQPGYAYYPSSVAATVQIDKLRRSRSKVQGAYWQWSNHGPRRTDNGYKGNITPGSRDVQIRFSSRDAANACTMAQTAAVLGDDPLPYLKAADVTATTAGQSADTLNLCVLQPLTLPENDPVILDYEVQDDRTAEQTLVFLTRWTALVHKHGRMAILYPNALDGGTQAQTQLTPVASKAAALFDFVNIMLWSGNTRGDIAKSFAFQADAFNVPPSKLIIAFELNKTTLDDARTVHELLASGKAGALNFWRNRAVQGGSCSSAVNRKIACAALGRCS